MHKKELSRVPMASSYDAEALFPLEGMDEGFQADNLPNLDSESDTDGKLLFSSLDYKNWSKFFPIY